MQPSHVCWIVVQRKFVHKSGGINNAIEQYFFFSQETNTSIRQYQRQHNLINRVYQ